jgi:hypothetical protein
VPETIKIRANEHPQTIVCQLGHRAFEPAVVMAMPTNINDVALLPADAIVV